MTRKSDPNVSETGERPNSLEREPTETTEADSDQGNGRQFERRDFLKVSAIAAAGSVSLSGIASAETLSVNPADGSQIDGPLSDAVQQASDGDVIDVASGVYTVDSISNDGKAITITGGDVVLEPTNGGTILDLSGDGWTFDGFGFDFQNTDSPPSVALRGDQWQFANTVFWNTKLPSSSSDSKGAVLYPNVPSGGTGTIRNCYLHDGAVDPDGYADYKAVWAGGDNIAGTLVVDGMWCESWAENTLYVSKNSGSIEVRNSYFRNTNVSGPRLTDSAVVENTTFVLDGKPPLQYRNGTTGSRSVRGVWWNAEKGYYGGDVTIRNCDFAWKEAGADWANNPVDASDGDGGALSIEDTNFLNETGRQTILSDGHDLQTSNNTRGSADTTPPIPSPPDYGTTPNSSTNPDSSNPPAIDDLALSTVETNDDDAAFDVSWQVGDLDEDLASVDLTLTDTTDSEREATVSESVSGGSASGTTRLVATGDDGSGNTYEVELVVTDADGNTATDTAAATADEVTIEDVWNTDERNEIRFVSTRESTSDYLMRVFGSVEGGTDANLSDGTDSLTHVHGDEYVVDGIVGGGGQDNWWVSGHVDSLTVDDGMDILVNGTQFSANEVAGVGTAPDTIDSWTDGEFNRVELSGSDGSVLTYDIVVSGDVAPGPNANLSDGTDKLIQTGEGEFTIKGVLTGGTDSWDIDGKVTAAKIDDGITTTANGTECTAADLEGTGTVPDRTTTLPNTVVIESQNGKAEYELTVSGDLVFSTTDGTSIEVDDGNSIDGSTASGTLKSNQIAYAFSGDVVDYSLIGEASVTISDSS